MDNLIIIGAGGHGKVLCDIAEKSGKYKSIAFLDDVAEGSRLGYPIVGKSCDAEKFISDSVFIVAIGSTPARARIMNTLSALGARFATLVHPATIIGKEVSIGEGTAIMAGVVINSSAKIGRGCIINTHSVVEHDCEIGDLAHVSVGVCIAGESKIGARTWVGAGATVSNCLSVCSDCMIGAGAVVVSDITEAGTYIGVPAKKR